MFRVLIVAVGLVFVTAAASRADRVFVDWTGAGGCLTISEGIEAVADGDTVLVAPGTYSGEGNRDIGFESKNITVMSTGGSSATTISADDRARRGVVVGTGQGTVSLGWRRGHRPEARLCRDDGGTASRAGGSAGFRRRFEA